MNLSTIKLTIAATLVHLMCLTVVLSHMHASDAASLMNQQTSNNRLLSADITAKAMGDLHHHIDKQSLKNVTNDTSTTAARRRQLSPLAADEVREIASLLEWLHDFGLRLRIASSLIYQYAYS